MTLISVLIMQGVRMLQRITGGVDMITSMSAACFAKPRDQTAVAARQANLQRVAGRQHARRVHHSSVQGS